jgi:hypothetical protein
MIVFKYDQTISDVVEISEEGNLITGNDIIIISWNIELIFNKNASFINSPLRNKPTFFSAKLGTQLRIHLVETAPRGSR